MRQWLHRMQERHDEAQLTNLYSVPKGAHWSDNAALQKASETLDKWEAEGPGQQHIFWVPNVTVGENVKSMLADKYGQRSSATMLRPRELNRNAQRFRDGSTRFIIAGPGAANGYNFQNAAGAVFVGLPKHAIDHIQARARHERDPRTGDPKTTEIQISDSPIEHRLNHIRANERRLVTTTNPALRGDDPTGTLAKTDAYVGQYQPTA